MKHDPLDILARWNPIPDLNETLPGDEDLLSTITASPVVVKVGSARRRRTVWAVTGTTVIVLAVAAFAILREESPSNPTAALCYSEASARPAVMHGLVGASDPIESCAELWRNGVIALGDAPALTGCITDAGSIAVVPGQQQVCAELGLANWVGELTDEELELINFQQSVIDRFASRCVPRFEAADLAQQLLDDAGLTDWAVADNDNWNAKRPCAGPGVDPATKTVTVGGRQPQPGEDVPDIEPSTTSGDIT